MKTLFMKEKQLLDYTSKRALKRLNKMIRRVFGLESLAQVIAEMAAVELTLRTAWGIEKGDIGEDMVKDFHDPHIRSRLREYWAKYATLRYIADVGQSTVLYRETVLDLFDNPLFIPFFKINYTTN